MLLHLTSFATPRSSDLPLLIDTFADCRNWLSTSLTVAPNDSVTAGPFSVYEALAATLLSTGASSTAAMVSVVVWIVVLLSVPSLTTLEIVRLGSVQQAA